MPELRGKTPLARLGFPPWFSLRRPADSRHVIAAAEADTGDPDIARYIPVPVREVFQEPPHRGGPGRLPAVLAVESAEPRLTKIQG